MTIYDISQEIFSCQVYPGDPAPERRMLSSMEKGGLYNLTAFNMCAHNGTHVDAPFHFLKDGKTIESSQPPAVQLLETDNFVDGVGLIGVKAARPQKNPESFFFEISRFFLWQIVCCSEKKYYNFTVKKTNLRR